MSNIPKPSGRHPRAFGPWMSRLYFSAGIAIFAAILFGYQATGVDDALLDGDDRVAVTRNGGFVSFTPRHMAPTAGLLFLPGALVDPDAYAPLAHAVAAQGYRVTIVFLPLRLAPTDSSVAGVIDTARLLIRRDPSVRHWAAAGHSKGGKIAARFVREQPGLADALILVGTSHPDRRNDLSAARIHAMKIYGMRDGLASPGEVLANRPYLPAHTEWVRIDGGNHAQFAAYRFQLGDRSATISRRAQHALLVAAILRTLHRIDT